MTTVEQQLQFPITYAGTEQTRDQRYDSALSKF